MSELIKLQVTVPKALRDRLKAEAKQKGMLLAPYVVSKLEEGEKPKEKALAHYSSEDKYLVDLLFDLMKGNNPSMVKTPTNTDYDTMRKIRELDKRDARLIEAVVRWSQQDEFWHRNILSVGKLREKFDRLALAGKADTKQNRVVSV